MAILLRNITAAVGKLFTRKPSHEMDLALGEAFDKATADFAREAGGGRKLREPKLFYGLARGVTGALDQTQVNTIEALLKAAPHWRTSWMAYALATAWHEARLKPIEEWGKGKGRAYAKPGKYGQSQHGRGLVQLTWDRNYEWADKALKLGGTLLANFNRALEPEIATAIMVRGMEEGAFTGKALRHYLKNEIGTPAEFEAARRIINGTDKQKLIAIYAGQFQTALLQGGWNG